MQKKDNFDYWKELYRSLGITIYLRKPCAPEVFAVDSLNLKYAGVYEVKGLRAKLLAARRDMSEILFQLYDREGKKVYGKAEKGLTLDKLIFKNAHYLEEQRDLRFLGIYGSEVSVEIPGRVVNPAVLSWRKIQGTYEHFQIIHLFPKHTRGNVKIEEPCEIPALA